MPFWLSNRPNMVLKSTRSASTFDTGSLKQIQGPIYHENVGFSPFFQNVSTGELDIDGTNNGPRKINANGMFLQKRTKADFATRTTIQTSRQPSKDC